MKVCTDACILGAWAPVDGVNEILDIGTGTGLLALMLAQRCNAHITAVEIDEKAAAQAKNNAVASKWADRVTVYNTSLQNFNPGPDSKFDLIISNPPFFVNSLKPEENNERLAKHTDSLSFADIALFAVKFLESNGKLCIMLPPAEQEIFASTANNSGLYSYSGLLVRDKEGGKILRIISNYSFKPLGGEPIAEELIIKQNEGNYTLEFRNLLKEYYLAF